MIRLYSNENFDFQVVGFLRQLGYDVLTALDAGRANQRIPDEQVLEFAMSENRTVLTFNRKDFFRLHKMMPDHSGIIACTYDNNHEALAKRIDESIKNQSQGIDGRLIRIYRPG